MKYVGDLIVMAGDTRDLSGITEVTGNVLANGGSISLPACTSVGGYVEIYGGAKLYLPACTSVGGYVEAHCGAKLYLPACTSVGGYVRVNDSSIDLPACTSVGGYVRVNDSSISLPACTSIKGESFQIGSLRMVDVGPWTAILTPGYLSIGCLRRTWDEWLAMSDTEIAALDYRAAEVATKFRAAILAAKGE